MRDGPVRGAPDAKPHGRPPAASRGKRCSGPCGGYWCSRRPLPAWSCRIPRKYGVEAIDPTRLCVKVIGTGHTGYEVERILFDSHDVAVEMSDFANVLANVTIGHDRRSVERLTSSLRRVADRLNDPAPPVAGFPGERLIHMPAQVLSPTEAFHAPQERVALADSVGRVAAEMAASYPLGIPVVVPGERLMPELVEHLAFQVDTGCRIVGPRDPDPETVQVVCE